MITIGIKSPFANHLPLWVAVSWAVGRTINAIHASSEVGAWHAHVRVRAA